ncbi:methyl-accepting chemotaxis protein [Pokkaliibacter plantistimulans]|nr:methyl-accepting chemotaxis protein [Pokkaliibacter plantistimulans]
MMTAYRNLSIRNKLLVSFLLLAVLFCLSQLFNYQQFQRLQQGQQKLIDEQVQVLMQMKDVRVQANTVRALLLGRIVRAGQSGGASDQVIQQQLTDQADALRKLMQDSADSKDIAGLVQSLYQVWGEYATHILQEELPLLNQGKFDAAREQSIGIQAQRISRIRELGDQIAQIKQQQVQQQLGQAAQQVTELRNEIIGFFVLVLLIIALVIAVTSRSIARPLEHLTGWARQIASGELVSEVRSERRDDEVGRLADAFQQMSGYLRSLAQSSERIARGDLTLDVAPQSERDVLGNAFARMVANLRELLQELQEGIGVLATASQEILASTAQVASGAQQTAIAITEITTTVEEVRQTANTATQKARHVSDSAQRTLQVSKDGKVAIDATMEGMSQIREQMHSVAQSIVRLSEQAQAIGEVVATVNELAEQSNLLGVNASIEATRSGEQGRGFSVVAQEVKNLAVQSKQATGQVRTILNDVQKALNQAVLQAEQSSKAVDSGHRQAQSGAVAINTLAYSIEESSGAALQIAASSQQQMVGMDQMVVAMESIKQASQENVEGTKQTESAARNLHQLGQKMKVRVGQFQL